jgi:hypothetical protein
MAVHFLYPSDIIGVIFHHHRGGSTTREAERFHPRVLAFADFQAPGEPVWVTARGVAWNLYLHGAGQGNGGW